MADFFENYQVIKKIGEGTFSHVFMVKHFKSGKKMAAKKLSSKIKSLEEALSYPEISAIKLLDYHPNVLEIVDIAFDNKTNHLFLISNLMDMSLYDYMKTRTRCFSEQRCRHLFYQMVCGLNHLHRHGIFHRDIKPENILIKTSDGLEAMPYQTAHIQIADFGSICLTTDQQPHTEYISTRWYRAPECLISSGYYGPKIDIWSLGCVFYEILTLQPLFPGDNELDQLDKIHSVFGVPSERILSKFKHPKAKFTFPHKRFPVGIQGLLPNLSKDGLDALRKVFAYHPDYRINSLSLLEHLYFTDNKCRKTTFNTSQLSVKKRSASQTSDRQSQYSLDQSQPQNKSFIPDSRLTRKAINLSNRSLDDTTIRLKQREQLWGMNPSKKKQDILSSIKTTFKN